jgi:hypothetical protein
MRRVHDVHDLLKQSVQLAEEQMSQLKMIDQKVKSQSATSQLILRRKEMSICVIVSLFA